MKIVLFNAPPHCGKDTLADMFIADYNCPKVQFKDALYKETANFYGIAVEVMVELATARDTKEVPHHYFDNLSPRGALIHVSEDIIKPVFGDTYFGKKTADALLQKEALNVAYIVVPDSGFSAELVPLAEEFGTMVTVVRLHREGYDFTGDSRSYLTDEDCKGVNVIDVTLVDGQPQLAYDAIRNSL
jgi:hypothetical protein